MDLSLDEIIKSKKISLPPSKKFGAKRTSLPLKRTLNRPVFKETQRITDARLKIIQRNRAKIRDARDKLAEITRANGDVRRKLLQKQYLSSRRSPKGNYRNGGIGNGTVGNGRIMSARGQKAKGGSTATYRVVAPTRSHRHEVIETPRGYVDYDNMEQMEEEEYEAASRLSRTVKNDIASDYEAYGNSRGGNLSPPRRLDSWSSSGDHFDPFDVYEVPHERHERRTSPNLPPPPPKGILRSSGSSRPRSPPDLYQRRYIPESSSHLSYEMRSRLEHAPDPHASMGIFSNPLKQTSSSSSTMSGNSPGYRIVVSNLHTSVTQSDIRELFEDIGELYESRIVRPGIAEVIYKSLIDAEKAVDTYHNRQLDGQPMKCLLVNPRASNKPTAPAMRSSSSSRTSGKTPLEIDIDALHKVLFRRH